MMLGELYLDEEDSGLESFEGKLLESIYTVFALIIMLNLLIAIISDTFEKVKEKEQAQDRFERANLLVEYEANVKMLSKLTWGTLPLDKVGDRMRKAIVL